MFVFASEEERAKKMLAFSQAIARYKKNQEQKRKKALLYQKEK